MGCNACASGGGCGTSSIPGGCQNNGSCMTGGCSKLDVYDWLSHMDLPSNYKAFNIVEVKFKGSRKDFYINEENIYLEAGELVAVESPSGGYDIGHVSLTGELVRLQIKKSRTSIENITKKIFRKATESDVAKWKAAKELEWETMHNARKLALDLGLSMKISDVDYQGDKSKATFYYTAEGRVDFRELIKKMAEAFRIRIEMRQIGMRQEASRLGGIGACGRELCCSTWLTDFKTVSTSAARYQNLSLNTLKLAGQCGKLKCCLNYELDSYLDALKDIPNDIDRIDTEKGYAYLQKTDIFKKLMWFSYPGEENWIALTTQRVKEIKALNEKGEKPAELGHIVFEEVEDEDSSYDYENVVGQESLTRLDEKNSRRKRKRKPKAKTGSNSTSNTANESKTQSENQSGNPNQNSGKTPQNRANSNSRNNNSRKAAPVKSEGKAEGKPETKAEVKQPAVKSPTENTGEDPANKAKRPAKKRFKRRNNSNSQTKDNSGPNPNS